MDTGKGDVAEFHNWAVKVREQMCELFDSLSPGKPTKLTGQYVAGPRIKQDYRQAAVEREAEYSIPNFSVY